MTESFEQKIEREVKDGMVPGAVLIAGDKEGKFRYEKAFGYRTLKDPSKPDSMQLDATMWMASCTKLVTSIAAMQCVERGQLTLDGDVTGILPELKDIEILTGFDQGPDGKDIPILVKNTKPITLRQLLNHSSGLSYDIFNPMLMRFRATQGFKPTLSVQIDLKEAYFYPLLFAPGEKWSYGVGIDWAGWMVERVNGNIALDSYIQKNIWDPLSVKSMTFFPKKNQATMSKLTDMSVRSGDITMFGATANPTGKLEHTNDPVWNMETIGCSGGSGGYGAPLDYHKMLHSILTDDGKLLKKETVDEMFKPSLTSTAQKSLMELLKIPEINHAMGGLPMGTKVDYGLSGIIALEGVPDGRKKGAMAWGGYPNLLWWIDRVGGISGIYGTQVVPPGDPKAIEIRAAWEKEIYQKAGKRKL